MRIQFIPEGRQAPGSFNQGEIKEFRPVFPDGKYPHLSPFSNLFYWANAWAEKDSTIGLHPHKGFEIMSFVIKGDIEHYDTKLRTWKPLKAGDVQIIRSGSGISHSEKMHKGAQIFQIWFDPNLSETFGVPATYNDYTSEDFPVSIENDIKKTIFKGENAPIEMHTKGVEIWQAAIPEGDFTLSLPKDKIHACFVIEGALTVENQEVKTNDFFKLSETDTLTASASIESKLFIISTLLSVPYRTYANG